MSSPKEETPSNLLAGHAPAVKVGGKRVVQHPHPKKEPEQPKEEKESEEAEFNTDQVDEKGENVAGAIVTQEKQAAAVKTTHEKPMPKTEKPPQKGMKGPNNYHLNQPQNTGH